MILVKYSDRYSGVVDESRKVAKKTACVLPAKMVKYTLVTYDILEKENCRR